MKKNRLITAAITAICVIAMISFVSYANAVGRESEKEAKIRKFSFEVREKTRLVADEILSATRQNVYAESGHLGAKEQQQKLQTIINFERLAERKDTADFLKIGETGFYEDSVIRPGRDMLQTAWTEAHKKSGAVACDLSKQESSCYPGITKELADLTAMKKELAEMKGVK